MAHSVACNNHLDLEEGAGFGSYYKHDCAVEADRYSAVLADHPSQAENTREHSKGNHRAYRPGNCLMCFTGSLDEKVFDAFLEILRKRIEQKRALLECLGLVIPA